MPLFRGFINAIAPQIDNTEKALQEGVQNITFAKPIRRNSELPQRRQISRVQTQTEQTLRVDTPPPPIPERNQARPGYTLRIRDIRQEHQRRRQQEHQRPEVTCLDTPKPQPEQQNRQLTLTDAELSKFLRKTRPGFPRQRASPNKSEDTMAGTRPQRITSHQIFLNDQVKTQQDATDAWALQTGKPTPPYQFEDFIGKGAYGRVFRA